MRGRHEPHESPYRYEDEAALRRMRGRDGPLCCVSRLTGVSRHAPR